MTLEIDKPAELTERERSVIGYLSTLMEANARMIGEHILKQFPPNGKRGSGYQAVGAGLVSRLRKLGLIYKITELNAWRLTAEGRALAAQLKQIANT